MSWPTAAGEFISVAAYEANKTVTQTDPEISEAIDFCTYYAQSARLLERYSAEFTPYRVTVVTPPWNFPVAIPTGGIAAARCGFRRHQARAAGRTARSWSWRLSAPWRHRASTRIWSSSSSPTRVTLTARWSPTPMSTPSSSRGFRHRQALPFLEAGAQHHGGDLRQERAHHHPVRGPGPGHPGPLPLRLRPLWTEVLGVLPGYLRRCGRESQRLRSQLVDAVKTLIPGPGYEITTTMNGLAEALARSCCAA